MDARRGLDWGLCLWVFCKKKTPIFSSKLWYSFSGWGICYLSLHSLNKSQGRPEKHASISCDCQVALKALQAIRTSFLVEQCQKALNDMSALHAVGLYWVYGHAGVRGNEIAHTTSFWRRGSERVELHLYSPSRSHRPAIGWTLPNCLTASHQTKDADVMDGLIMET
jgi:hypothetical protein